jgi:hypothetical protein
MINESQKQNEIFSETLMHNNQSKPNDINIENTS